jgi:tetratricopeptide (TPR) repeat protein
MNVASMLRRSKRLIGLSFCLGGVVLAAQAIAAETLPAPKDLDEVLVYSTLEDGSIMHWLAISPLRYDVAHLGDSMSADVLEDQGRSELTARPRAGDRVQKLRWQKMHFSGAVQGPTMCDLFDVSGGSFDYGITYCCVYLYSPADRPGAVIAASSDDALKLILNGRKIWSNQIQRSPTYDSDRAPAPLRRGWNVLIAAVDQVIGGHLLCARFLDGGKAVTDLEISLDPPAPGGKRHAAGAYNKEAAALMRSIDAQRLDGKLAEALSGCRQVLARYPLADVAPRAAYMHANLQYSLKGEKSLGQPDKAIESLETLLARYPQDLLAEYALLDLATIHETALRDMAGAEASYRSFEDRYPQSTLAAKAVVGLARLLAANKKPEEALLTYRKAMQKYPASDEVMTATVGVADTYLLAGDKEKARRQYQAALAMAQDWHDNKYGVDVGKQAWLRGIIERVRPLAK